MLPAVLTIVIVLFVIKVLTNPLMGTVMSAFDYYDIFNKPFLFLSGEQVLALSSRLSILICLFVVTIVVGFIGRWFLVRYLGQFAEFFIHRIPLVNKVYRSVQDVVHTLFAKSENNFSAVVLVPFPHSKMRSLGLITSHSAAEGSDATYSGMVSVFVPGTPNPAMGFMLMYNKDQLTPIDMTVQDALKFLVSCGVIAPDKSEGK